MLRVLAALLFATVALGQTLSVLDASYTGYIIEGANNATFDLSNWGGASDPCLVTSNSLYYYTSFNYTWTTAGVRYIQLIGSNSPYVAVYRGAFNPANTCTNRVNTYATGDGYLDNENDNQDLDVTGAYYFTANQVYTFVIFDSSATSDPTTGSAYSYAFGIKLWDAIATQATTASSLQWQAPTTDSSSVIQLDSSATPYTSYAYIPTVSGFYDVGVFAVNETAASFPQVYLGIFSGTPNTTQIADATTAPGTNYFPNDNSDDQGVWVFNVGMIAGQTYTFVASNDEVDYAYFGFFVIPTTVDTLKAANAITTAFTEPNRASFPSNEEADLPTCTTPTSNTARPWTYRSFVAQGSIVLFKTPESDFNNYLSNEITYPSSGYENFIYRGFNNSAGIVTCPIIGVGSYIGAGYGIVYNLDARSAVHTIMITPYSSSPTTHATDGVLSYAFYGPTLNGPASATPTNAPSTPTNAPSTPTNTPSTVNYDVSVAVSAVGGCSNSSVVSILNALKVYGGAVCTNTTTGATVAGTFAFPAGTTTTGIATIVSNALAGTAIQAQVTASPSASPTNAPTSAPPSATTSAAGSVVASTFAVVALAALLIS